MIGKIYGPDYYMSWPMQKGCCDFCYSDEVDINGGYWEEDEEGIPVREWCSRPCLKGWLRRRRNIELQSVGQLERLLETL